MEQHVQRLQDSIFLGFLKNQRVFMSKLVFKIVWTNRIQGCHRSLLGQQP